MMEIEVRRGDKSCGYLGGSNMRAFSVLVLVVAAFVLLGAGCQKSFTVEFTNFAQEDLEVSCEGPGLVKPAPRGLPIAGDGGSARFEITVDEDDLPCNYHWQAGSWRGAVVVRIDSANLRFVDIGRDEPGVSESTGPVIATDKQTQPSPLVQNQ